MEAKAAEINCALGLTAGDLLFANVEQNTINKRAIANRQNKPIKNRNNLPIQTESTQHWHSRKNYYSSIMRHFLKTVYRKLPAKYIACYEDYFANVLRLPQKV